MEPCDTYLLFLFLSLFYSLPVKLLYPCGIDTSGVLVLFLRSSEMEVLIGWRCNLVETRLVSCHFDLSNDRSLFPIGNLELLD